MAGEPKFNHIVVDAEEDEVVIQAGSVPRRGESADRTPDDEFEPAGGAEGAAHGRDWPKGASGQAAPSLAEDSAASRPGQAESKFGPDGDLLERMGLDQDDISDEARKEFEEHARRSARRHEAAAMVTTEEDLHAKMPFVNMQRVIAIVLLLLVIAFAFYWYVSHSLAG